MGFFNNALVGIKGKVDITGIPLDRLPDDFMEQGREDVPPQPREYF